MVKPLTTLLFFHYILGLRTTNLMPQISSLSSGHSILGLCLWVIFPFCLFVYCPHCAAPLCCTRKASLWCGGQIRGDFVYFGGGSYNSYSFGSLWLWVWKGLQHTIELANRGCVMGGICARLQQNTKLQLNTPLCLTSVNLWQMVLLIVAVQYYALVYLRKLSLLLLLAVRWICVRRLANT